MEKGRSAADVCAQMPGRHGKAGGNPFGRNGWGKSLNCAESAEFQASGKRQAVKFIKRLLSIRKQRGQPKKIISVNYITNDNQTRFGRLLETQFPHVDWIYT
jgi:hypothetical protein